MTTITFDTLKYSQQLEKAGIPREQAEAMAYVQKESLSEIMETQVATKSDIVRLEGKITLVQWMLAVIMAAVVLPILKGFFN